MILDPSVSLWRVEYARPTYLVSLPIPTYPISSSSIPVSHRGVWETEGFISTPSYNPPRQDFHDDNGEWERTLIRSSRERINLWDPSDRSCRINPRDTSAVAARLGCYGPQYKSKEKKVVITREPPFSLPEKPSIFNTFNTYSSKKKWQTSRWFLF